MTRFEETVYRKPRKCIICDKRFIAVYPQEIKCSKCAKKTIKYRFCKGTYNYPHEFYMMDKEAIWCPFCKKPTKLKIGRLKFGLKDSYGKNHGIKRGRPKGKKNKTYDF